MCVLFEPKSNVPGIIGYFRHVVNMTMLFGYNKHARAFSIRKAIVLGTKKVMWSTRAQKARPCLYYWKSLLKIAFEKHNNNLRKFKVL
jgi:hypothetical protein